ncbi:uncharacterized protein LOC119170051 isoform X2 [Rhipicephalus microplus]|uniref:uncharacterized protein LOC119170051 isoform X2 n=1 Tax=Rhipicephalus microplus TaxID=6941 RepID=UPI003F6C9DE5
MYRMKECIFLLGLWALATADARTYDIDWARSPSSAYYDRHMEDLLHHKLGKFRSVMLTGYPSLGITAMDPLNVPPTDVSSIFGGDAFHFQLLHIQIRNLSEFDITNLRADTKNLKVHLAFQVPKVSVRMQYSVAGSLYEAFPLQGSGRCDIVYNDVTITTVARLKEANGKFQFTKFEESSVDFASDQVSVQQGPPVGSSGGLGSQVGRILFWTLSKQVARTLPSSLLRFLNDALERAPRPGARKVSV